MRRAAAALALALLAPVVAAAAPVEGKPAPALDATLLDGAAFSLDAQRGKVVVVNLWATWCAPCRAEMAAFDAYYRQHRDDGLVLLAVSMDDPKDEAAVRQVMQTLAFPAALVRDSSMKGYGRVWRLPLTFVIGRDGTLVKSDWYGNPGFDVALLEATVTPLLRAP